MFNKKLWITLTEEQHKQIEALDKTAILARTTLRDQTFYLDENRHLIFRGENDEDGAL